MQFGSLCENGRELRISEWLGWHVLDARALHSVALGRKNYSFADAGGERAAAIYSLIETAKFNAIDPLAHLTDFIARIGPHPARHVAYLLPYTGNPHPEQRFAPDA
jgi:transposase